MLAQEVARKYSHALFLAAKDRNLLDRAYEQLNDLKAYLEMDRTLLNFLEAPQVLDEHKLALVRDVFSNRLDQLFVEFLLVLVEKHRIAFLPEVIDEFARLVEAERGIGRATILTAVSLTDTERSRLTEKLAAKTGLEIVLEERVDPDIIGGVIVILHNEIIDGSVRRGLDVLREQLSKVRVA
ncbi:MAG: ATP synthase F1 subunit delta [Candidatus Zixiibacteriota bacterium]